MNFAGKTGCLGEPHKLALGGSIPSPAPITGGGLDPTSRAGSRPATVTCLGPSMADAGTCLAPSVESSRPILSAWQIVNAAPLTPRANDCRSGGEDEMLQHQIPSNRITKVTIGEMKTVNASSNLAVLTSAPRYGASILSVVEQGTKTMDDPQREQRQISVRACVSSTTLFLSPLVGINRPAPSIEMKSRTNTGINRSFGWVPNVTSECGLTAGNRPASFLPAGCPQTCEGSVLTFEPHHKPAVKP